MTMFFGKNTKSAHRVFLYIKNSNLHALFLKYVYQHLDLLEEAMLPANLTF
jgi:hypothetical protein